MKLVSFSFFCFSACFATAQQSTLLEAVASTDSLSTLATAAGLAGLEGYLNNTANLTVFAPTNDALMSVPGEFLTPGYGPHLALVLAYHVIEDAVITSDMLSDGATVTMLAGGTITASVSGADIFFSGPAFSDSRVVQADVLASNGVAHVVNQFFLPEALSKTLLDLASEFEEFGQVSMLVESAGLTAELEKPNRTILAPSDQAFNALDDAFITSLASDSDGLTRVLSYHILIGAWPVALLADGEEYETVLGAPIGVSKLGGGNFLILDFIGATNNVTFDVGDLPASNGLAHVIGGVLLPPQATSAPVAAPTEDAETPASDPVAPPPTSSAIGGGSITLVVLAAVGLFV